MNSKSLEIILAGGEGRRLIEVTGEDLPKPLVPFGDQSATIDHTISNAFHSGSNRILILTQYQADKLEKYIEENWTKIARDAGTEITTLRSREDGGYKHTADAVYQNRKLIERLDPDVVTILSADHIYSADYRIMQRLHEEHNADLTIAVMQVPKKEATRFGVIIVDELGNVVGFEEKSNNPKGMPTNRRTSLINLGVYVFGTKDLMQTLREDAKNPNSNHDFGQDIIPEYIKKGKKVIAYMMSNNPVSGMKKFKWFDIGVPDEYHRAHMALVGPKPQYSMNNPLWPLHIAERQVEENLLSPRADISYSKISPRARVGEARITNSVVFPGVTIADYAEISDSVILPNTTIHERSRVKNAIVRGAEVGPNVHIGVFPSLDEKRGITKTPGGVYLVTKDVKS